MEWRLLPDSLPEDKRCLILRNGLFSFRWNQILDAGNITDSTIIMKARQSPADDQSPFYPAPLEEVVACIESERPDLVFLTHVETSAGMMLPDAYLRAVAGAVHKVGGILVVDSIASGSVWLDMKQTGIDVLLSVPQKGWSSSPCAGLVMMNQRARNQIRETRSDSFCCDLKKWTEIMEAYEQGGHAYHATMPTDSLKQFYETMCQMQAYGLEKLQKNQQILGSQVRKLLSEYGFVSVAAEGFQSPSVIVCYTADPDIQNGLLFRQAGLQIAAGVPLMCDESEKFRSFRIGLFGLDKLKDIGKTYTGFVRALEQVCQEESEPV